MVSENIKSLTLKALLDELNNAINDIAPIIGDEFMVKYIVKNRIQPILDKYDLDITEQNVFITDGDERVYLASLRYTPIVGDTGWWSTIPVKREISNIEFTTPFPYGVENPHLEKPIPTYILSTRLSRNSDAIAALRESNIAMQKKIKENLTEISNLQHIGGVLCRDLLKAQTQK